MRKFVAWIAATGVTGACWYAAVPAQPMNSAERLDRREQPADDYVGPVFKPSYAFPTALVNEPRPWEAIDFKAQPDRYMMAVLAYVLEGQDTARWDVAANSVRVWYHMPWMGPGGAGREYISGLTSERRSRKQELGPNQLKCRQNWAVGFYNPVGGYTLGKVWGRVAAGTSNEPDLSALPFRRGTVVAKTLYTQATADEVPLLAGAPTIQAHIVKDDAPDDDLCPGDTTPIGQPAAREEQALRLLQLDIAVRDPRATVTGWVFGTFVYDGRLPGPNPWQKLRPVGLMWGNDPGLTDAAAAAGSKPSEGVFLSDFGIGRHFGRGGRVNGPVDNPTSSCLSCHATAQSPVTSGMAPSAGMPWAVAKCWFRNLPATQAFGAAPSATSCGQTSADQRSLDYSLQLAVGVRNVALAQAAAADRGKLLGAKVVDPEKPVIIKGVRSLPVSRDEAVFDK